MNSSTASPTYRMHWGLTETPFRGGIDPKFFYESPTHEEALARLRFLVEERQRLGMLMGESGTGKSMLLEVVARQLRRGGSQVANISLPGADVRELLWLIAAELGLNPGGRDDVFHLWRGILDRLAENRYQQLDTVFLFDDAHDASREVIEHVLRLVQVDRSPSARLTVVLSSAASHAPALDARLLELLDLRVDLDRWEQLDTIGYLDWSLAQAGRKTPAFTEEGMIRIHSLSDGIPRRVNQLASLGLMAGAARQLKLVDGETVAAIQHELGVVGSAA